MANKCAGTNFQGKGNDRNCNTYRGAKLLKHAIQIVEREREKFQELANIDSMQFGFMSGRGMTEALFVERRMQKEKCTQVL